MSTNLISAVHDIVLESGLGAKNIAAAVGKPYSTLLREVNPFDDGAKLGAETLVDIMRVTGNIQPLEHIADKKILGNTRIFLLIHARMERPYSFPIWHLTEPPPFAHAPIHPAVEKGCVTGNS